MVTATGAATLTCVARPSPARRAAYEVVLRVFEQDAYADRAFDTAARGLDERDRALAQRLAYGTVQRVRTLDHAIESLGRRPLRKVDPPVRAARRPGAPPRPFAPPAHARPAGARGAAARRLPDRVRRLRPRPRRRERVGRARARGAARARRG